MKWKTMMPPALRDRLLQFLIAEIYCKNMGFLGNSPHFWEHNSVQLYE
jgi:hypothetical protein